MTPNCYQLAHEVHVVEDTIRSAISSCYPRSWDENHITYTWLEKLRSSSPSFSYPNSMRKRVLWDAYKMSGKLEKDNGDVAFLVKVTFSNGNSLTGVAFLEAKRIYDSGCYEALKWAQLKRMADYSSHHHLLLYDFQEQEVHPPSPWSYCICWLLEEGPIKANGIVVPTFHALAYEEKDRSLSSIGYTLGEQIVFRYFQGLDLNFDQILVENVKAGVTGGVNFLAIAHVVLGEGEDFTEPSLDDIRPDEDGRYQRLENGDQIRG